LQGSISLFKRGDKEPHSDSKTKLHEKTSTRGFAAMDEAKQREIASKGERATDLNHAKDIAYAEARASGRKGGS
ncbi:hypothetical protein FRC17_009346, partial [Serendipita sp. 399]